MNLTTDFFENLRQLEQASRLNKTAEAKPNADIELYPNKIEDLTTERPFYLENVILATAADEINPMDAAQIKLLREKKRAMEPEDMIEKAHPKEVWVSNSLGDGGLVENQNEQRSKIMEVVYKLPTGNHIHLYAEVLNELVKIASELDFQSPEAAAAVDAAIAEISGREADRQPDGLITTAKGPFLGGYGKGMSGAGSAAVGAAGLLRLLPAVGPLAIGAAIVAAVAAGGYGVWNLIKGLQEQLDVDTADLVKNVESWKDDEEYATQKPLIDKIYTAAVKLNSLSSQLMSASASLAAQPSQQAEQKANNLDQQFGQLLEQFQSSASALEQNLPSTWFTALKGKLEDVVADYNQIHTQIAGLVPQESGTRNKMSPTPSGTPGAAQHDIPVADPDRIKAVQQYLNQVGFGPLAITGKSDTSTKQELVEFENYINKTEEVDGQLKRGLGLRNLPGNRLARLLDTTLQANELQALVELFRNSGGPG